MRQRDEGRALFSLSGRGKTRNLPPPDQSDGYSPALALPMRSSCIPQSRVPGTSALFLDYLYRFDRVQGFYSGSPFHLDSYRSVARELRNFRSERTELARVLTRQNA